MVISDLVGFDETLVGLKVERVRLSIADYTTYKFVLDFFKNKLTVTSKYGKGFMTYAGKSSGDNSIFVGLNAKLEIYTLVFTGKSGAEELESFRTDCLNLTINKTYVSNLNISSLEASYICPRVNNIVTVNDFVSGVTTFVQLQQKNIPKVLVDKNVLFIGGRTGSTVVTIKVDTKVDLSVNHMITSLKIKDKSGDKFYQLLLSSLDCSLTTVIAYTILGQLSRTSMYGCLEIIQSNIIKEFDVGRVVNYAQVKSKSNTSGGKYLIRSLNGITNKLEKEETTQEAQILFIDWLTNLYGSSTTNFRNNAEFFKNIQNVFVEPSLTTSEAASPAEKKSK